MDELLPREKLSRFGAEALTDTELLAIFLRTGVTGMGVMALAEAILKQFGSLYALMSAGKENYLAVHGIGMAKMTQLLAVTELSRRFFRHNCIPCQCWKTRARPGIIWPVSYPTRNVKFLW